MSAVSRETQPAHDFSGLTRAQKELLTFQGWEPGPKSRRQPLPQTVAKLIQRGLIVARKVDIMGVTIKAYDVPIHVHAAWCAHCSARRRG
jgi:hypothetical protein